MGNLVDSIHDSVVKYPNVLQIIVDDLTIREISRMYEKNPAAFLEEMENYIYSNVDAIYSLTPETKANVCVAIWSYYTERADKGYRREFDSIFSLLMLDIRDIYTFVKTVDYPRLVAYYPTDYPYIYDTRHYANLTSSLSKRVRKWVWSFSTEELLEILTEKDQKTIEMWKYVADLCHFKRRDFEYKDFLEQLFLM